MTSSDAANVSQVSISAFLLSLTGTGAAIWRLIDGTRSREQLLAALSEQFETSGPGVESDVEDFLARLRSAGLLAPAE